MVDLDSKPLACKAKSWLSCRYAAYRIFCENRLKLLCCDAASVWLWIHKQTSSYVHWHEPQHRPQCQVRTVPQNQHNWSRTHFFHHGSTGQSVSNFLYDQFKDKPITDFLHQHSTGCSISKFLHFWCISDFLYHGSTGQLVSNFLYDHFTGHPLTNFLRQHSTGCSISKFLHFFSASLTFLIIVLQVSSSLTFSVIILQVSSSLTFSVIILQVVPSLNFSIFSAYLVVVIVVVVSQGIVCVTEVGHVVDHRVVDTVKFKFTCDYVCSELHQLIDGSDDDWQAGAWPIPQTNFPVFSLPPQLEKSVHMVRVFTHSLSCHLSCFLLLLLFVNHVLFYREINSFGWYNNTK